MDSAASLDGRLPERPSYQQSRATQSELPLATINPVAKASMSRRSFVHLRLVKCRIAYDVGKGDETELASTIIDAATIIPIAEELSLVIRTVIVRDVHRTTRAGNRSLFILPLILVEGWHKRVESPTGRSETCAIKNSSQAKTEVYVTVID